MFYSTTTIADLSPSSADGPFAKALPWSPEIHPTHTGNGANGQRRDTDSRTAASAVTASEGTSAPLNPTW